MQEESHKGDKKEERVFRQMGNEVYRRSVLKFICFLSVVILLSSGCQGSTVTSTAAAQKAVEYEIKTVPRPAYGVLGGEWTVFALSRLGVQLPEGYEEIYMTSLKQTVKETRGKLSEDKYTEYSRVCLALAALGETSTRSMPLSIACCKASLRVRMTVSSPSPPTRRTSLALISSLMRNSLISFTSVKIKTRPEGRVTEFPFGNPY